MNNTTTNNTTTNNCLIDTNYLLKRFQTFEHAYAIATHIATLKQMIS